MNTQWQQYDPATFRKAVENISLLEKTGILLIEDQDREEEKKYYFYLKNGEIIYIKEHPVDSDRRIGNVLINRKYLSEEQLASTLLIQQNNKYEFLGDLLLKQGYITPPELLDTLTYQIENMIFQISFISAGRFTFAQGEMPERMPQIPYTITLSNLLKIFISSCDMKRKYDFLDDSFAQYFKARPEALEMANNSMERGIIELINKRHNIKGIFDKMPFHNYSSTLTTLLALLEQGAISLYEGSRPAPVAAKTASEAAKPAAASLYDMNRTIDEALKAAETPKKEEKTRKSAKPAGGTYMERNEKRKTPRIIQKPDLPAAKPAARTRAAAFNRKPLPRPGYKNPAPGKYVFARIVSFLLVFLLLTLYISILLPFISSYVISKTIYTSPEFSLKLKTLRTADALRAAAEGEYPATDGWGRLVEMREGRPVSAGPDGVFDTEDDIIQ